MLVIRLRRIGKKNKPSYRIVVAEHSFPVDGKFTADLGFYNPHSKAVGLKKEEVLAWMNKGAQPSNTVARILEKEKIKHGSVVVIKRKKQPKKTIEPKSPKTAAAPVDQIAETIGSAPEITDEVVVETETTPTEEVAVEQAEEPAKDSPSEDQV